MANTNRPHGFVGLKSLGGGDLVVREYAKAVADTTVIGENDLVTITGALDTVAQYVQDDPVSGSSINFGATALATTHSVVLAFSDTLFEAQEDSDGAAMVAADEGQSADVIVAAANSTTGQSAMEIDSSTVTNQARDVQLFAVAPYVDNTVGSNNARWFVLMNDRRYFNAVAGV